MLVFAIALGVAGIGIGGYAWWTEPDTGPTPDSPEAPPAEGGGTGDMAFCDRRVTRALARAAEKGPRKALNAYDRGVAFDSVGLPGSESFRRGVEGGRNAQGGGLWGMIIGAVIGTGSATAAQIECRRRVVAALEAKYGPKETWEGGGGLRANREDRREIRDEFQACKDAAKAAHPEARWPYLGPRSRAYRDAVAACRDTRHAENVERRNAR